MVDAQVQRLPASQSVIDESGAYVLPADRDTPLVIRADAVHLDLGGHAVRGPDGPDSRTAGIYVEHGCHDVRVENGEISGFMYGVLADDGMRGTRSTRVTLRRLTLARNAFRGALLYATHATVEACHVHDTGGTTMFPDAYVFGLEIRGEHARACRNVVHDFYSPGLGESVGISLSDEGMDDSVIESNAIINSRLPGAGRAFGAWVRNRAMVRDNLFVNLTYAFAPPEYRDPANTIDNIVIGEQCAAGLFGSTALGTGTKTIALVQPECLDSLERARTSLDERDAASLVRLASLLQWTGQAEAAAVYYRRAASLGCAEARRHIPDDPADAS